MGDVVALEVLGLGRVDARVERVDELVQEGVRGLAWRILFALPDGTTAEPIDVRTVIGDDWQQYRYKVYEAVIPLRNVLWQPT